MRKNFSKLALLVICLCALQSVFGQQSFGDLKRFGEMKDKAQRLREGKAYRVTETTETLSYNNGQTVKRKTVSVSEIDVSGGYCYLTTVEKGGVTEKSEFIRIGEKAYVKEGNGKWRIPKPEPASETYGLGSFSGGNFIKKTTFNGQTANVYGEQSSTTSMGDEERSATTRYWFAENGELLKTEADEKNLKTGEVSRVVTIYEYDPKIKIVAPIK